MSTFTKVTRALLLFLVNHLLAGTRFFKTKRVLLNAAGLSLGRGTKVVGPIEIGSIARLEIGEDCWIGKNVRIDGNGSVRLGSKVDVAPQVTFSTGGHAIGGHDRRAGKGKVATQLIGNGCWIGTHSVIVGDVIIDDGCVVAAGAVVIDSFPANVLIAGVPAQIKRGLK